MKGMDSGRGGASLWTKQSLDREEHRQLRVGVNVTDAGGRSGEGEVLVVVDDLNDNPMKSAQKTVYLWSTEVSKV